MSVPSLSQPISQAPDPGSQSQTCPTGAQNCHSAIPLRPSCPALPVSCLFSSACLCRRPSSHRPTCIRPSKPSTFLIPYTLPFFPLSPVVLPPVSYPSHSHHTHIALLRIALPHFTRRIKAQRQSTPSLGIDPDHLSPPAHHTRQTASASPSPRPGHRRPCYRSSPIASSLCSSRAHSGP